MKEKPRQYTAEEAKAAFMNALWHNIDYWNHQTPERDKQRALEGLAFSFLAMIDGCSDDSPGWILMPSCHPSDPEYLKEQGENWWPVNEGVEKTGECVLEGLLHEEFYAWGQKMGLHSQSKGQG